MTFEILDGIKFKAQYGGSGTAHEFFNVLDDRFYSNGNFCKQGFNCIGKPFNLQLELQINGLPFCKIENLLEHMIEYTKFINIVTIPDDAIIYIEHTQLNDLFMTDKMIIQEIKNETDIFRRARRRQRDGCKNCHRKIQYSSDKHRRPFQGSDQE